MKSLRNRPHLLGWTIIALCAITAAAVYQHLVGFNEASHWFQVRAFGDGTPIINRWQRFTGDKAFFQGNYYSDKAPGLAFFVLPLYKLIQWTGVTSLYGVGTLHLLVLLGCTLPFVVILSIAFLMVERVEPGMGAPVVATLGLGTILLPFATLFFSHVFSACLGFVAYFLIDREHRRREEHGDGLWMIALAGLLCGYALSTEYPLALLVGLLAIYVAWRPVRIRALVVFGAAIFVGLLPLFGYNWWAFGSPLHLSYESVAANSGGVLGMTGPSVAAAVRLLFANRGFMVMTPVFAAVLAGIVILWREGRRWDALVPIAVLLVYYVYDFSYYLPFGGAVPGPRFMLCTVPFWAVPLAAVYRKAPFTTLALTVISIVMMLVSTITISLLALTFPNRNWFHLLFQGWFTNFGEPGLTALYFVAAACTFALLVYSLRRFRPSHRDLMAGLVAVVGWFVIMRTGPLLLPAYLLVAPHWVLFMFALMTLTLIALIVVLIRRNWLALGALLPLLVLCAHRFDREADMFGLIAVALVWLAGLELWSRREHAVPAVGVQP
jgi:hypothetical protein